VTATLNGLRAVSVRLLTSWRGVWIADVDVDPDVVATVPTSGPAVLVIGDPAAGAVATLLGTVDPRGSGVFVASGKVRVVGGGGGWDKPALPQDFSKDAGVTTADVLVATGLAVGEKVVVQAPIPLGLHFWRGGTQASNVLDALDWWVDFAGITNVGTRLPSPPDPSLEILGFDPARQLLEVACDAPIVPGTLIADPVRLPGGPLTVRDVEQTFTTQGSRASCWCSSSPVSPLQSALVGAIRRFAGVTHLRTYRYRIGLQGPDGRVQLQLVNPKADAMVPTTLPLEVWAGQAGLSAKYKLGSECLVAFMSGDPAKPFAGHFDASIPLQLTADATVEVDLGPSAPLVLIAGGSFPLVVGPWATGLASALATFATAAASATTAGQIATAAGTLASALSGLPPATTTKTKAT